MPGPLLTEITLDRSPCLGECPVLHIVLFRRSYRYEGLRYVAPLGEFAGPFPPDVFGRLERLVQEMRILELEDEYPITIEDLPATSLSLTFADGSRKRSQADGDAAPDRLWAFANLVEMAVLHQLRVPDGRGSRGGTHAGEGQPPGNRPGQDGPAR